MGKIRGIRRHKFEAKLSHGKNAAAIGLSKAAVSKSILRASEQGLGWPLRDLDNGRLVALLYRQVAPREHSARQDSALIHQELKRKGGDPAAALGGIPEGTPRAALRVQLPLRQLPNQSPAVSLRNIRDGELKRTG